MRKVYLALGVLCEIITFVVGLSFAGVGLNLVNMDHYIREFQADLQNLPYRVSLVAIGVAVMLVSLRVVFLLLGSLKGRREVTLLKNEQGDVKATISSLERMLRFHLDRSIGGKHLKQVNIVEKKKGKMHLYVTLVPEAGQGLEALREQVHPSVHGFCESYKPLAFTSVNIEMAFEDRA